MASTELPVLAVVYGPLAHEQPIDLLIEAAVGVCRLIWVLPHEDRATRTAFRVRRASGGAEDEVVDVSNGTIAHAADLVRAHRPSGVTCFTDENIQWTSELAEQLGLRYHSPSTATRLTDKLAQRAALASAALPTPPFWDADDLVAGGQAEVALPVVLKPRGGFGSIDTELIRSAAELETAVARQTPGRMIVEGFIPDPTRSPFGDGSAPYVCVDLIADPSGIVVMGMTGRTPVAEPFRETGSFFPADAPDAVKTASIEAAIAAVRALGIEFGVLRVEVKWTDDGPVVIEVNGRPDGGNTRAFLRRALGVDSFQIAMRVALGQDVSIESGFASSGVHFRFDIVPDMGLRRIDSVQGLDEVAAIPGVEQVIRGLGAGEEFSWRDGSFALVATVLGSAPDHKAVRRIRDEVNTAIVVTGSA